MADHPHRDLSEVPRDRYLLAWSRLRWLRVLAFAALLLVVPGTWAMSIIFGDAGLLALVGFGLLFRALGVMASDFPCPHCGSPFARAPRRLGGLSARPRRRLSLFRRECRGCGIRLGTSEAAARESVARVRDVEERGVAP